MSRTYRRTVKGNKKSWLPSFFYYNGTNYNNDYFYGMNTPSAWNNTFHQRPFRRKNRDLLKQILNGYLDADEIVFPATNRKPHIYYW